MSGTDGAVGSQTASRIRIEEPRDAALVRNSAHPVVVFGEDAALGAVARSYRFRPGTGKAESSSPKDLACWFIDTDYNEESFFVRHAYFLGQNDPYSALKTTRRNQRRSLVHPQQRHLPPFPQTGKRPNRSQSNQPPRG